MTADRLSQLLAAYGADPSRWPADERDLSRRLAADPALAHEAGTLDRLLNASSPPPMPDLSAAVLAARVTAHTQPLGFTVRPAGGTSPRWSWMWPRVAGFASVALVGFVVGFMDVGGMGPVEDEEPGIAGVFEDSPW